MATVHEDNPAGRLWRFLEYTATAASRSTDQKPITLRAVWAEYFGIAPDESSTYFARISAVLRLPVEIREEVADLVDPVVPRENLTRPLDTIETLLASHADGRQNVHKIAPRITDGIRNDVENCSFYLSRERASIAIDAETIAHIRAAAADLIAEIIADSTLPPKLRAILLRYAHRIAITLDEYAVRGGEAVIEAWDAFTGVSFRNAATVAPAAKIWAAFRNLGLIISTVVAVASAPQQIGAGVEFIQEILEITPLTEAPGDPAVTTLAEADTGA